MTCNQLLYKVYIKYKSSQVDLIESGRKMESSPSRPRKPSIDFSTLNTTISTTGHGSQEDDDSQQHRSSLNISYQHEEEFAKSTSCHGISHVFDNSSSNMRRLLWMILTVSMTVICLIQCIDRVLYLASNPTRIVLEYNMPHQIRFPAVTICNYNRFRNSTINQSNRHRLPHLLRLMSPWHTQSTARQLNSRVQAINTTHDRQDDLKLLAQVGEQADIFIKYCIWNNQPDSCSAENFTLAYTEYGNCFTFNGGK